MTRCTSQKGTFSCQTVDPGGRAVITSIQKPLYYFLVRRGDRYCFHFSRATGTIYNWRQELFLRGNRHGFHVRPSLCASIMSCKLAQSIYFLLATVGFGRYALANTQKPPRNRLETSQEIYFQVAIEMNDFKVVIGIIQARLSSVNVECHDILSFLLS